ncbi:MAG: macro domain-containing protein [Lachnospiraceae bacterium]|nr:macro domain-containing protein [Lachnospiraceae bacterium]
MAFRIVRDDITNVSADAIVNPADEDFTYGVGQAVLAPAFGHPSKYIIHTVAPEWTDGEQGEREALRLCYENCLNLALENGCESIAFPLIAAGSGGFPKEESLQTAVAVFGDFLSREDMQIILAVSEEGSLILPGKIFSGVDAYIDENYISEQPEEEYEDTHPHREKRKPRGVGKLLSSLLMPRDDWVAKHAAKIVEDEPEEDTVEDAAEFYYEAAAKDEGPVGSAGMFMAQPQAAMFGAATAMSAPSLDERVTHVADTWQENLLHLIDERGYTDIEVYKRANVDRKLFSKIRSNASYQPKKITALAFALALRLNLDETKDFLSRAGYALSPSSVFDLIIKYFIEQEVYDTYSINLALFEHDQPLLGE